MRTLLMTAFLTCLAVNITAGGCFDQIEKKIPAGDTITVFTTDSALIRGTLPSVMAAASMLHIKSVDDSGFPRRMVIPISKIDRISYDKPCRIYTLVGLAAGITAGIFAGAALAPEPSGWLDFPEVYCGMVGAFVGGVIGAGIGAEIDKSLTLTVNLKCR